MYADFFESVSEAAAQAVKENETDYRGANGLLMCGSCRTAKEVRVEFMGIQKTVRCICKCEQEKDMQHKARMKAQEIERLRSTGIQDKQILSYTFGNDDGKNAGVSDLAKRYVENFADMKRENIGLLFYGEVGTGKSFFAGCIGHALIDRGVPVLATSITRLLNQLFSVEDKNEFLRELNRYDLLIIDDIGAERGTEYALEQVYTIIDERYKSCKPVIVTTNKTPQELETEQDMQRKRIYDRFFQMCTPIKVEGQRRKEAGQAKARRLQAILYGE